jgi:hypothetical protein
MGDDRTIKENIMNIIYRSRGTGKTEEIIKCAYENGYTIICRDKSEYYNKINKMSELGIAKDSVSFALWKDVKDRKDKTIYVIDDVELFLKNIFGEIDTISLSSETHFSCTKRMLEKNVEELSTSYNKLISSQSVDYGKSLNILKNISALQDIIKEM